MLPRTAAEPGHCGNGPAGGEPRAGRAARPPRIAPGNARGDSPIPWSSISASCRKSAKRLARAQKSRCGNGPAKTAAGQARPWPRPPLDITLPAVVNGQIMPGESDRLPLSGHKGPALSPPSGTGVDSLSGRRRARLVPGRCHARPRRRATKWPPTTTTASIPIPSSTTRSPPTARTSSRSTISSTAAARFRLSHDRWRAAVCHRYFSAGRPRRHANHRGNHAARTCLSAHHEDARGKAPGLYPLGRGPASHWLPWVPFAVDALPECRSRSPSTGPRPPSR